MDERLPVTATSQDFRGLVSDLLATSPAWEDDPRRKALLESILATCVALASDGTAIPDLKLIDAALAEMRRALNCFAPYSGIRKVATFGSARSRPADPEYRLARDFAAAAAKAGYMIITGAGPGVMRACQEGAGRERSFGVNIQLFFLKESSAIVLFPGGFGTHDESFEALTLVQTGKSRMVPIIFMDVPGGTYWQTWNRYVEDHILGKALIDPEDLSIFRITDRIEDAVEEIDSFYRVYHSARTIRNRLVIRTRFPISDVDLDALSADFADVLRGKPVVRREPYEEEHDEPATLALPRLVLHFDMKRYGRLRQLINRLNQSTAE
jgi:predicted Rossmann-fold nucleotide-binding protein